MAFFDYSQLVGFDIFDDFSDGHDETRCRMYQSAEMACKLIPQLNALSLILFSEPTS